MDSYILLSAWIVTAIALLFMVPKDRIRDAWTVFFFKQFIDWPLGLIVAEMKLIEYPVRLFAYANKTNFTFEYFIYPAIGVIFIMHYPEKKRLYNQILYYIIFCTGITSIEVICEKYTNIIRYTGWTWYYTLISLFLTFYITRLFYIWFKKSPRLI